MNRLLALLCFLLLTALPLFAFGEEAHSFAVVSNPDPADRLNLRAKPDTDAISLGKFYNGTPVTVLRIQGEWAYVSLYKDFDGWMHTDFLTFPEDVRDVPCAMPFVTITSPSGKTVHDTMLSNPSVSAHFPMGSQLEVMGVMEDWLFVRSGESIVGFTKNSGTMPLIFFSPPEATPAARLSIITTPTPSPTPLPLAADGNAYAMTTVETVLFADEAMTVPLSELSAQTLLKIESFRQSVCWASVDGQTGYVSASCLAFGVGPQPSLSYQPVEDARRITQEDWVIFASMRRPATLFADKAMTQPIAALQKGELLRVFNDSSKYATLVKDDSIAGYFPAGENMTVHTTIWPFHIDYRCAAVSNPVVSDRLHLRESPGKNARSLGRYYNGTIVALLNNFSGTDEWTHVRIGEAEGYMMSDYLDFSPHPETLFSCLSIYEVRNPNTGNLHLRAAPDTASASLGLYPDGTLAAVIGVTGDWAHVLCDGQTGYMLHRHLYSAIGTSFDPY